MTKVKLILVTKRWHKASATKSQSDVAISFLVTSQLCASCSDDPAFSERSKVLQEYVKLLHHLRMSKKRLFSIQSPINHVVAICCMELQRWKNYFSNVFGRLFT